MAVRRNTQLEKVIEDVSKSTSLEELHGHLQSIIGEEKPIKCSKHFLSKLDKLMCMWFEKCRNLWVNGGPHWNETLLSLCEDFSDTLLEVHGACDEGTNEVTESFLYLLGHLAVDTRIYILIRKEAMRKFNIILDKIPAALKKKKISSSKEASDIMLKLAAQILDGGDYDFQTALTESLCRMASSNRRKELAGQWFSISHVATAFVKIRDAEFETDCRKFLNLVNGMQGDLRRVYSYPCLGTFLDQHELSMPADENLEEFWIDFNLGSRSISFYFSLADDGAEEGQWETFSVIENEVESYTVAEKGKRKVLQIRLPDGVHLGAVEGSSLSIHFNSSLDIQQAACKVFGEDKRKSFMAKKDNSVVKTEIRIQMVEDGSQAVVPESQVSVGESQNDSAPFCLPSSLDSTQVTMTKVRNSQSSAFIKSTGDGNVHKARTLSAALQTRKPLMDMVLPRDRQSGAPAGGTRTADKSCSRDVTPSTGSVPGPQSKASEQASINTGGKYKKNVPVQMDQAELQTQHSQEDCVVPDTQPKTGKNTSLRWRRQSVSEMIMMPTQKMSSLPTLDVGSSSTNSTSVLKMSVPNSGPINQCLLNTKLTQRLQDVVSERNENVFLQQPSAALLNMNVREDVIVRESVKACCASSMPPQKPKNSLQTKVNGRELEGNVPLEAEKQAGASKSLQKQTRICKSKEKSQANAVAGNMVKIISSHYKYSRSEKKQKVLSPPFVTRPVFNTTWSSTVRAELCGRLSINKPRQSFPKDRNDVFAFNMDSPLKTENKNLKRHLFSDTDTDHSLEVSWLKESHKKPCVAKYSRQAPIKLASSKNADPQDAPRVSPKLVKGKPRAKKKTANTRKPAQQPNKPVKSAAAVEPQRTASRRPQRAAASFTKSYRETDTDDSLSASEYSVGKDTFRFTRWNNKKKSETVTPSSPTESVMAPPVSKKCCVDSEGAQVKKSKPTDWTLDSRGHSDCESHQMRPKHTVTTRMDKTSGQEQTSTPRSHQASPRASLSATPSIEKMRYAQRATPNLALTFSTLPTPRSSSPPVSPDPPHPNSPSPVLQLLKPHSSVSSRKKAKASYSREKTPSVHSARSLSPVSAHSPVSRTCVTLSAAKKSLGKFSPPRTPLTSCPPLTSTLLSQDKPALPSPPPPLRDGVINCDCRYSFSNVSSVVSLSQSSRRSSVVSRRVTETLTDGHRQVKTLRSNEDRTPLPTLESGPCPGVSFSSSDSEAEERQKSKSKSKARSKLQMKPRRLFNSFNELSAEAEKSQVVSSFHTVSSAGADGAEEGFSFEAEDDVRDISVKPENLCQQLNFEIKKKCQMRCKMMELYNQQSLKTVQQHVSSINMLVQKDRTQRLEEVGKTLLGEIQKLEQEDLTLKTMEKDLITSWKKQSTSFHSYREQETKRNETLKTVLQGTMCHTLEYEERIFTSQMGLIMKDMKSAQDRLMIDMQQKEIQNIKQGLHALFFPGGGEM